MLNNCESSAANNGDKPLKKELRVLRVHAKLIGEIEREYLIINTTLSHHVTF